MGALERGLRQREREERERVQQEEQQQHQVERLRNELRDVQNLQNTIVEGFLDVINTYIVTTTKINEKYHKREWEEFQDEFQEAVAMVMSNNTAFD